MTPAKADTKPAKDNTGLIPEVQQVKEETKHKTIVYGKSGLGENLICEQITPDDKVKSKILMTFEIHGFEDLADHDGQSLVDTGKLIAKYYIENNNKLKNTELYIIPSLNPDGLNKGYTNNGPGRCQISLGIDINRDFDYHFETFGNARYHTLSKPCSAPESAALRDFVKKIKPDAVIDCHGWNNMFIGDKWIADCFKDSLGISTQRDFSNSSIGFFSAWASTTGAKSMLLEYPENAYGKADLYADKTIKGINKLVDKLNK